MHELVEIRKNSIDGETVQTVDARELHAFLENGDAFANWIKDRIEQYGFVEGRDFTSYLENAKKLGGRRAREYAISLDMAKELAMVERNDKGKQARQYFIECEKRVKAVATPALPKPEKLVGELAIAECFIRLQHPAPSAQIAMLAHIGKKHDLDVSFLPAYAIDAAPDATGGSSMPTKPLTDLLRDHGIGYTAKAYNLLLRDVGVLEERTRRTTDKNAPGGVKRYWAVSLQGLQYGKNLTSPSSPRETQPHWYVERFAELHALVFSRLGRAAA